MADKLFSYRDRFQELRQDIRSLVYDEPEEVGTMVPGISTASVPVPHSLPDCGYDDLIPLPSHPVDLILTPNEINLGHGTGVLLKRFFKVEDCFNLRSRENYEDKGDFMSHVLNLNGASRTDVYAALTKVLGRLKVRRIISIPFFEEDFLIASACKSILGVPMAVWFMDDVLVHTPGYFQNKSVDWDITIELMERADMRFVISPEMRDAYEHKYHRKFHMLPPMLTDEHQAMRVEANFGENLQSKTCVMLGNVWDQAWLDQLMSAIRSTGWTVHWYGTGSASPWLNTTTDLLAECGIIEMGFQPEELLAKELPKYPFAIIPSGSGLEDDPMRNITLLSMPSRLPFLLAVGRIPVLILGSDQSCSARFVERFGVGMTSLYEESTLASAIARMTDPNFNREARDNCEKYSCEFLGCDVAQWIWESVEKGSPRCQRFERVFERSADKLLPYLDDEVPSDIYIGNLRLYVTLERIARFGYKPDFIFDVGASTGYWSFLAHRIFSDARYILVEPIQDQYVDGKINNDAFEWVKAAASDQSGTAKFQVSNDLYGSSLMSPDDNRTYETIEVPVVRIDQIMEEKALSGHGMLKIDVQYAEHLVLDGAVNLLHQVDFLIIELTLLREVNEARTFLEICNQLDDLGFEYFDDVGEWRCPVNGILIQKDVIFIKRHLTRTFKRK
jgi:FkbM family methyltransferase